MCQVHCIIFGRQVAKDMVSTFQKLIVQWGRQTSKQLIWCGLKQEGHYRSGWGRAHNIQAEGAEVSKEGWWWSETRKGPKGWSTGSPIRKAWSAIPAKGNSTCKGKRQKQRELWDYRYLEIAVTLIDVREGQGIKLESNSSVASIVMVGSLAFIRKMKIISR